MASPTSPQSQGIEFRGNAPQGADQILSPEAVGFVAELSQKFESTRQDMLRRRQQRQLEIVDGRMTDFLPKPPPSANALGLLRGSPPISATAASRLPVPWTAK